MDPALQLTPAMSVATLAVLIGILINNSRLSDLRAHVDDKFAMMEKLFMERLRRVEEVIDARLTRIENDLKIR